MPSQSWQFKTAHLPESHLLVFSHIPALLLQLKPSNLYSSLSDALFWWVCWGSTRRRCPELCRRSPSSQQARSWKHSHVFSFCSSRVTSQNFLARPHTAIIKLFPTPKVIGRHGYWIFLHVAYFSPLPFFLLNKHAHFPIFLSPDSLASFPLHKRCQETRSVKQCAAFLNNCVTTWNGTCESFKKNSMCTKGFPEERKQNKPKQDHKGSTNLCLSVEVHPSEPNQARGVTWTLLFWRKLSKNQQERVRKRRFNWDVPLSRLTRSYPPLTIEGNEQWGTEEAFGMDPSLMNRGGENSQ